MNKNLLNVFCIISLILFVLAGCSNVADATYMDLTASNGAQLKVYATTSDNSIDFSKKSSSSKTILPEGVDAESMYFYLWGTNRITRASIAMREVSFTKTDSPGTGYVDFIISEASSYEMTLVCTKEHVTLTNDQVTNINNVGAKAYFAGFASVDLRYIDHVLFYLSPYHATGNGNVALKLYIPWTIPSGYNITIGLYDFTTDAPIYMNDLNGTSTVTTMRYEALQMPSPPAVSNYNALYIKPGVYNLKVKFTGVSEYIFSEDLIVLANQTTSAERAIPNVLEKTPSAAPTNFIAGYKDSDTNTSNYYSVEFSWDDNANNENYYELEVIDVTNAKQETFDNYIKHIVDKNIADADKNDYWKTVAGSTGVKVEKYTPDYYGDSTQEGFQTFNTAGALLSNNSYIDFDMPLGKRFIARIKAVNNAGSSDYCYANLSSALGSSKLNTGYNVWNDGVTSINRFRINYNLNGGRFYEASTDVTNSISLYRYYSQIKAQTVALINPNETADGYEYATGKKAVLKIPNTSTLWTKWQINGVGGTDVTDLTYSGYNNVEYCAYYDGTNATSSIQFEVKENSADTTGASTIMVFGGASDVVNVSSGQDPNRINVTGGNYFEVSRGSYPYIWLLVNNPAHKTSLTVSMNYGQTTTISATTEKTTKNIYSSQCKNFGFTNFDCYTIDIRDTSNYLSNEYYNLLFTVYPNGNTENPVNYFMMFKVVD